MARPIACTLVAGAIAGGVVIPGIAWGQANTLLLPSETANTLYDRGHNISVAERPRPEYDPLGIRLGSFVATTQLSTSWAYSSNVFNDNTNRRADSLLILQPYVGIYSDWKAHQAQLVATGDLRRYANTTIRNQNAWSLAPSGRLDISDALKVRVEGQVERGYESPFSGDVIANLTVPSRFLHSSLATRAVYGVGRSRISTALERNAYSFDDLVFADGTVRQQNYRDRVGYKGSLTYEYGFSPSVSLYARAEADRLRYSFLSFGQPNRDSNGYRLLGGANFDLAGVARGTIGIGYGVRNFDASYLYQNLRGFSAEARGDWFPSELTTVSFQLQRVLSDTELTNVGAMWTNRAHVSVDHELLYNLILTGMVEAERRDYPQRQLATNVYQGEIGARYQARRGLGFQAAIGYGSSRPARGLANSFDELRARVSVILRR
ncbi:outer membrane beta-barrel protein [uncultured Sphingomonas sp.]|uniref:outer membrane beta-barrel protein n=1 Tax=uncultured Sphingomonas sp. TaxID=158754 RepID=UPI0025FCF336|nr:outer membrane beta-barrel protein [uncultured Sphingomonas sp.]